MAVMQRELDQLDAVTLLDDLWRMRSPATRRVAAAVKAGPWIVINDF
jgi:hypothetical protein